MSKVPNENFTAAPRLTTFQLVILVLSVYVLIALFVQTSVPLTPETSSLLDTIDNWICIIFLGDFFWRLYRAKNKKTFLKWGWIDFISSIPTLDALRWGRAVRIVRVVRLLRAVRSTKLLTAMILRHRVRSSLSTVALFSVLLMIASSIAVLNYENHPDANIQSANDALWWAVETITTVGYGDRYPVTVEGRIVGAVLMLVGIAVFGVFTAAVASFFVEAEQKDDRRIDVLTNEIRLLQDEIRALREGMRTDPRA